MRKSRWPTAASDADFGPYLRDASAATGEMFWRFVALARAAGPVTFELQNGPIVLCGTRRIFASVRTTQRGLAGHLNLTRRLSDRRIIATEPLTKRLIYHKYFVAAITDLDDEFGGWLAEARDVGDGR